MESCTILFSCSRYYYYDWCVAYIMCSVVKWKARSSLFAVMIIMIHINYSTQANASECAYWSTTCHAQSIPIAERETRSRDATPVAVGCKVPNNGCARAILSSTRRGGGGGRVRDHHAENYTNYASTRCALPPNCTKSSRCLMRAEPARIVSIRIIRI